MGAVRVVVLGVLASLGVLIVGRARTGRRSRIGSVATPGVSCEGDAAGAGRRARRSGRRARGSGRGRPRPRGRPPAAAAPRRAAARSRAARRRAARSAPGSPTPAITRAAIDCTGAMSVATTRRRRRAAGAAASARISAERPRSPSAVPLAGVARMALVAVAGATRMPIPIGRICYKVTYDRVKRSPSRAPSARTITGRCRGRALAAVEAACAARRLRLTPARAFVLETLLESHRAMTAYELLDRLGAAGLGSQPPVAYRALDFLVANGFVHRIERLAAFAACTHGGAEHTPASWSAAPAARVAETALPRPGARARGRGRGVGLRHRADGGRGRGPLRPLPGGRRRDGADRGAGPRGRRSAAIGC